MVWLQPWFDERDYAFLGTGCECTYGLSQILQEPWLTVCRQSYLEAREDSLDGVHASRRLLASHGTLTFRTTHVRYHQH